MIIKGGSRGGPSQLAKHLQRRDTNEHVEILELQSAAPNLAETFRDWQTLVEGTRGTKGLYHANIDPAEQYTMTPEQWWRTVEVLEKELGFEGQPRAVILHQKYGREHLHVVWARTDIDQMILRSDSQNYQAHERASQKLELEFGHEHVPGKHAKRDREKQPEFPRADSNHAEWQEGERTGVTAAERKDQITALKQASDSAAAFKAALEEQGYILSTGRRDFVLVDPTGNVYSLARQIRGMKAAELREFMKGVAPTLPTVEQAKDTQKEKQEERLKQAEALISAEPPAKTVDAPDTKAQWDAETDALRKAVVARLGEETRLLMESHAAELDKRRQAADFDVRDALKLRDASNKSSLETRRVQLQQQQQEQAGIFSPVADAFSPERVAQRDADIQRELVQLAANQRQRRDEYASVLQQTAKLEIENLIERQALALHDHITKGEHELESLTHDREAAHQLQLETELEWYGSDREHIEVQPAPEQQRLNDEKKVLSPDEIQPVRKNVIDQPRDAAAAPERQGEFDRINEQQRIRTERKDRITAKKQVSATAEAFRVALATEGYILARGTRGGLMVVDRTGAVFGLARQIPGMTADEFREFMKGIDRDRLPSAREARQLQKQNWKDKQLEERTAAALEQRPARRPKKYGFPLPPEEIDALRKAVADRQNRERAEMRDRHNVEFHRTRKILDDDVAEALGHLDATQDAARRRFGRENAPAEKPGVTDTFRRWLNPEFDKQRDADIEQRRQQLEERLKTERTDYAEKLRKTRDDNVEYLAERHAQERRDHFANGRKDLGRYIREREAAQHLRDQLEQEERQRERDLRDGLERPPPRAR